MTRANPDAEEVVSLLTEAYEAEISTALNYIAISRSLEGIQGEYVSERLEEEIDDEFDHAQEIATHLDTNFDTVVPSASDVSLSDEVFAEPAHRSDDSYVRDAIDGVVLDETEAIERYRRLCEVAEEQGFPATRHLCEELLQDEIEHRDEFESLLETF